MSFVEYLEKPELAERYNKVRRHFYLRESAYDVTSACQLRCEGCYYFQGDKYTMTDQKDPQEWHAFFQREKARGITYVVLAGAEPALVPKILQACYDAIPLGSIASNGLRRISPDVGYRLHLSVWGDSTGDPIYRRYAGGRPGPNCLPMQLQNYKDDKRVVFVYTFNHHNTNELDEVLERVSDAGHRLSFNVFSQPRETTSPLKLQEMLDRTREKMVEALEKYPDTVIYSYYNAEVHTDARSLHQLFGCPYPRAAMAEGSVPTGLSKSFRSYRTDLSHKEESDCCVPDTDCADCRHYAAGSAIVSSRFALHVDSERKFRGWLDYVDAYLATWLIDYRRGPNLYTRADYLASQAEMRESARMAPVPLPPRQPAERAF
jgi:organic radical activating enzyme